MHVHARCSVQSPSRRPNPALLHALLSLHLILLCQVLSVPCIGEWCACRMSGVARCGFWLAWAAARFGYWACPC